MTRTIKVTRTARRVGGYLPGAQIQQIPTLNISGNWLAQAGFAIGSKTKVEVKNGQLVISVK